MAGKMRHLNPDQSRVILKYKVFNVNDLDKFEKL